MTSSRGLVSGAETKMDITDRATQRVPDTEKAEKRQAARMAQTLVVGVTVKRGPFGQERLRPS